MRIDVEFEERKKEIDADFESSSELTYVDFASYQMVFEGLKGVKVGGILMPNIDRIAELPSYPTKLSDLVQDIPLGDIYTIKVNNITQPIVDHTVSISVPTKLSELEQDVPFASSTELEQETLNRINEDIRVLQEAKDHSDGSYLGFDDTNTNLILYNKLGVELSRVSLEEFKLSGSNTIDITNGVISVNTEAIQSKLTPENGVYILNNKIGTLFNITDVEVDY